MEDEALGLDKAYAEALARGCARFVTFLGGSRAGAHALPSKETKAFTERAREPQNGGIDTGLFCPIRLHTRICASWGEMSSHLPNLQKRCANVRL
jgi:hypothetical protein